MEGETRPTFEQAFSAEASAAASPAAEPAAPTPPADPASADATAPPADPSAPAVVEPAIPDGPIPFDRHKAILENARQKARDEALAEWRQQYGWAEQTNREQLQEMAQWYQRAAADPVAHVVDALNDLVANPQYAPQIRSHAARILGTRVAAAESIEAGIPIQDEHGNVVARTYTDAQIKQLIAQGVQEALGKEVAPLKKSFEQIEQERTQRQIAAEAQTKASTLLKEANEWPGFAEHKAQIAQVYQDHPALTLEQAYLKVLKTDILPKLTKAESDKVLANLQTKAAASALNPATAAQSAPKRPRDFYEAFGVER